MEEVIEQEILSYQHTKIMDNEHLSAYYYPEKKLTHYVWKQRTIGEPYRQAFLDGLKYGTENKTHYFISDIRNQGIVGPDDRKWFESVAVPAAIELGLTKVAAVFDGNTFKMYYINMILQHVVKKGVPMKFFKDLETAEKWLFDE
jgi:hypothetical protein